MKNEENPSKGRGNPGGSQSGGTEKKENTQDLKNQSQKDKEKRKDSDGNFVDRENRNPKGS